MIELKNINLDEVEFSYIKDNLNMLYKIEKNDIWIKDFLFIKMNSLNIDNRWIIRKAINNNPNGFIVLISNFKEIARFAWRINAFYFIEFPLSISQIMRLQYKITNETKNKSFNPKLRMNFKGGFKIIDPSNINIIKGQGSYCDFYFNNEKSEVFTARINSLANIFIQTPFMARINKSLIINLNNLTRIQNGIAYFKGDNKIKLAVSETSIKKIRNELLWLNEN